MRAMSKSPIRPKTSDVKAFKNQGQGGRDDSPIRHEGPSDMFDHLELRTGVHQQAAPSKPKPVAPKKALIMNMQVKITPEKSEYLAVYEGDDYKLVVE